MINGFVINMIIILILILYLRVFGFIDMFVKM